MTQIRTLFDASKDIQRAIEKVITYQASQEQRLKAEIFEYIVTESIEQQLEQLLEKMQAAMEAGSSHEIGVWVSGFYGSGKSSFTKYLGLAFDERVMIDGRPFLRHLQDRLHRPTTKALLSKLAVSFPAAVVMLDLASEQIAGASLAEVSTVLYYKVLQYAGYSRNLKVAALERRLRKEGRHAEFEQAFRDETGEEWINYRNDELVVDSVVPRLAHKLYPNLFCTEQAFTTASGETVYLMDDRVQEMIDIVREASGKEHIIFVIDEIGQYVGSQQTKILDLQGLAQNLKDLGDGKVWIVGTAQQTLTEDDPRATINSPELYKLKDRFPITVALESSDIKEICFRRLLGKSSAGAAVLSSLFDHHGQALRQHTKLTDAKFYDSGFDCETFTNLYPFLPAHFDINSKEERKAMRDASQAPRNSRELAVRNQFFTPRYVVEFLVDNTLGRLWFNWTGGQTGLRDRCQYLLVKPDEQPEAAVKLRDPRTIKLLDPACGSMHFGLYAFDLFLEIYREAWAWEDANGPGCLDAETGGSPDLKPLCQSYVDQEAFLLDVPRLIIEHNIYGVDIDPRAAQIASLALWLRAQRAWHEASVRAKDRPEVGLGHVVAAVAPPAEVELRERFMEKLDLLDAELFEQTLFLLKGLPELGVLLQFEKELPAMVRKVFGDHGDLFHEEDMAHWQKAEARLQDALTEFARAARVTYQGRLFAEDALQGLRMIDHCRELFDVVIMNPPFGAICVRVKSHLELAFPLGKSDLLAIFVERALELLRANGLLGAITSRGCFFQSNLEAWRAEVMFSRSSGLSLT